MTHISLLQGDITTFPGDAIVNAANRSLLGGGGVDGAIHRAAGPQLLKECRSLGGCGTGEAKHTQSYDLACKWIIHTVGPVWEGGGNNEDDLLESCYRKCMRIGQELGISSVAFPAISTGVYAFPFERATEIAFRTIDQCCTDFAKDIAVTCVYFSESDYTKAKDIYFAQRDS